MHHWQFEPVIHYEPIRRFLFKQKHPLLKFRKNGATQIVARGEKDQRAFQRMYTTASILLLMDTGSFTAGPNVAVSGKSIALCRAVWIRRMKNENMSFPRYSELWVMITTATVQIKNMKTYELGFPVQWGTLFVVCWFIFLSVEERLFILRDVHTSVKENEKWCDTCNKYTRLNGFLMIQSRKTTAARIKLCSSLKLFTIPNKAVKLCRQSNTR